MDRYINPPSFLEEQKARIQERAQRKKQVPEEPQRDVLLFLLEHAPLENWERDVLGMVRDEAYYFAPQGMTKIMNEGWASLQHCHDHDPARAARLRGHRLRRPPRGHPGHDPGPA